MSNLSAFSRGMTMVDLGEDTSTPRVVMEITLRSGGFFAGHFHKAEEGSKFDDVEIYRVSDETTDYVSVRIFLKNPETGEWRDYEFSKKSPWILIPPSWPHAGLLRGEGELQFNAYTKRSHTRAGMPDGNVVWLSDDEQPKEIRELLLLTRGSK